MGPLDLKDHVGVALCYLIFAWPPHILIGGIGSLAAVLFRFTRRPLALPALKASWIFAGMLYVIGFALNIVWNVLVFGRLYWAFDYAGFECSPFGLIIYSRPEVPAQFFHGMTEGSIRGLWFIYAAFSWALAIWATYRIIKRNRVEQGVPGYRRQGAPQPEP